jgi:hypothetical protein
MIGSMMEVYNSTGQVVLKSTINNQQSQINIPEAATGVYVLRIITPQGIVTRKLVKM